MSSYELINLVEPWGAQVQSWVDQGLLPPGETTILCGRAGSDLRTSFPGAPTVGLGCGPEEVDVVLELEGLTPSALTCAVGWARQRRALEHQLEQERSRSTEVMAHVSHEMRNPVTVLNFMAQLANDPRVKPAQKEAHLATLQSTARNLMTLLNDLLDYAKLGRGALQLSEIDFSLRKCLEDSLLGQRLVAEDKGVNLSWAVDAQVPDALVGDPGRLRQILTNLTGNAVKFTGQGQVVRVVVGWDPPNGLRVEVQDSGIGIEPSQLERIFQPYTQAAAGTSRKFGGTGLGLAISRQLVEAMGGSISVSSQPGQGSVFSFRVCLRQQQVAAPTAAMADLAGLRVLLFSSSPAARRLLMESMAACEVEPTLVESADALEEQAAGHSLVIYDLGLKAEEAFEPVRRLRQRYPAAQLRIIVFTTAGHRGDAARCLELGVSAYLTEPLEAQDWREALALSQQAPVGGQLITRHSLRERR